MLFVGIDPGKYGGIATIYPDGQVLCSALPLTVKVPKGKVKQKLDIARFISWMQMIMTAAGGQTQVTAYIEQVGARPGQGVTSMFSFGFTAGALHGIVNSYAMVYTVTPQRWKKDILCDYAHDKIGAIQFCVDHYPEVSLLEKPTSRVPHDGMADALCIAEYARRIYELSPNPRTTVPVHLGTIRADPYHGIAVDYIHRPISPQHP